MIIIYDNNDNNDNDLQENGQTSLTIYQTKAEMC